MTPDYSPPPKQGPILHLNSSILNSLVYWDLFPVRVHCDINHFCFGYAHSLALAETLNLKNHPYCDRRCAHFECLRIEANQVTDKHRLVEDHFFHRHGNKTFHVSLAMGVNGAGGVD